MDSTKTPNPAGGPSLSQYFSNDPAASFFDEIARNKGDSRKSSQQSQLSSNAFEGSFQPSEYLENAEVDDELKVAEDVRNFWEPPITEPGIPPHLTMPGVHSQSDLSDPIKEAVMAHLDEREVANRKILTVDDVTQDERGLRQLIAAGCYRSAVNLTGRLLTIYGQGYGRAGQPAKHSSHSLQLWFSRLALLAKLGKYDILQTEAEPFEQLNHPDIYFDFYPEMYGGKKGSMACFSFRLLIAEIPIYTGSPRDALDRLSELHSVCEDIKKYYSADAQAVEFWRRREVRVLHSIINVALMMKEFTLLDDIIRKVMNQSEISKEEKRSLFSAWGRIYLQIGDIFGAEQKFAEARRLKGINSTPDLRDLVDKGLVTVAQNNFQEAFLLFQKALPFDNGNTMLLNNMGVCLLYAGKLKEAIKLFERAIELNPQKALNESLLINLSTLYELESSISTIKKLNLLRLVNKFKPDLNISLEFCLKLQSGI